MIAALLVGLLVIMLSSIWFLIDWISLIMLSSIWFLIDWISHSAFLWWTELFPGKAKGCKLKKNYVLIGLLAKAERISKLVHHKMVQDTEKKNLR